MALGTYETTTGIESDARVQKEARYLASGCTTHTTYPVVTVVCTIPRHASIVDRKPISNEVEGYGNSETRAERIDEGEFEDVHAVLKSAEKSPRGHESELNRARRRSHTTVFCVEVSSDYAPCTHAERSCCFEITIVYSCDAFCAQHSPSAGSIFYNISLRDASTRHLRICANHTDDSMVYRTSTLRTISASKITIRRRVSSACAE